MIWYLVVSGVAYLLVAGAVKRFVWALFWAAVLVVVFFFLAPRASHATPLGATVLWQARLFDGFDGPPSPQARGVVATQESTVTVPRSLPPQSRLVLAADPAGALPLLFDDALTAVFTPAEGPPVTVEHDFRDGPTVVPWGPVDLTEQLPHGTLQVQVALADLVPPETHATPVYLVLVQDAPPTAPTFPAAVQTTPPASPPEVPDAASAPAAPVTSDATDSEGGEDGASAGVRDGAVSPAASSSPGLLPVLLLGATFAGVLGACLGLHSLLAAGLERLTVPSRRR